MSLVDYEVHDGLADSLKWRALEHVCRLAVLVSKRNVEALS